MQDEEEAVGRLIQYMQAMQGQPLWPYEESTLQRPHLGSAASLQFLVQSLVREDFLLCESIHKWLCNTSLTGQHGSD